MKNKKYILKLTAFLLTAGLCNLIAVYGHNKPVENKTIKSKTGIKMVWIKSDTFIMGSPADEKGRDNYDRDQHSVTLAKGFYMGKI